jgi:murein DD-endopeptidase MepM/ murein hydrolase activator NlpD
MEKADSLILLLKTNFIRLYVLVTKDSRPQPSIRLILGFSTLLAFGIIIGVWGGYRLAQRDWQKNQDIISQEWQQYLANDHYQLKDIQLQTEQQLELMSQHLGRIEANIVRLNALGERLVTVAKLDKDEFNFNQDEVSLALKRHKGKASIAMTLKELDMVLDKRYAQMNTIHLALLTRIGQSELSFSGAGKPVAKGWISSFFGHRSDPISGHSAWHKGVDIVSHEGDEIRALAGGVVSFADVKGAYGQMVEINHGNGLATRYGHNKELLVRPGQLVKKGQTIALLGSTGRSTGPHVHLEVHKNGEAVDPGQFFPDLKRK